jgi:hypothetical protein
MFGSLCVILGADQQVAVTRWITVYSHVFPLAVLGVQVWADLEQVDIVLVLELRLEEGAINPSLLLLSADFHHHRTS